MRETLSLRVSLAVTTRYRAMTTDTLTHDDGAKVRYQLNKTVCNTKFMNIENGPRGPRGAAGAVV